MKYAISVLEKGQINIVKILSEVEYNTFLDYCQCEENVRQDVLYCIIVRDNLFDFFSMVDSYKNGDIKASYEVDRLLLNWLNSFYCWVGFHEKYYKQLFAPIANRYYDTYSEYRFAYEFRKQFTHSHMSLNMAGRAAFQKGNFFLDITQLLQSQTKIKKDVQSELKGLYGILDLEDFAEKFISMFTALQKEIWEIIMDEMNNKADQLQNELDMLSNSDNNYFLSIISDEGEYKEIRCIGNLPRELRKVDTHFLLPNWLLDHPKVDKRMCPYV